MSAEPSTSAQVAAQPSVAGESGALAGDTAAGAGPGASRAAGQGLKQPRESCNVGLLGFGTVGSAFAALLESRAAEIGVLCGSTPVLSGVLTRSRGEFAELLGEADVVVELIGGIEPAREYVLQALRAGRHVITANKQLLCAHGEELFDAARDSGAQLRFEAAVAGVVPVIRVLQESLAGAHVERIHGIVNGTTNFILSEMAAGAGYPEALAEAQRQGIAEANPSEDVSGKDAAAKMAILARLAFGVPVSLDGVHYEGIEHIQGDDLLYAREFGLGLKLIGTAERLGDSISVRVHPAFLYAGHPLASVSGPFNAVTVESAAITEITMSGPGAGGSQTASAVLGDLVSALSLSAPPLAPARSLPLTGDIESAFYVHVEVADRPGVLAAVAGVLGEHGASIKSVIQRGIGEHTRLVMVTHKLLQSRLAQALSRIAELDLVRSTPRAIPVIEEEFT
ncbi:MAG: homoserine dehydrogenase [Solirubrobacteraceae bacterium]